MKRKFIIDGSIHDDVEELEIKADLTDGSYPVKGDGLYITEFYGDGRVIIEELDSSSGEEVWSKLGTYCEYYEVEE